MKQKDNRTIQERAQDLEKVLTFSILQSLRKHYDSLDSFKKTWKRIVERQASKEELYKFHMLFKHTKDEWTLVLGKIDGKNVSLEQVLPHMSKWIHLRKHFNYNYKKSGKTYKVKSYWYIDFDVLERWWDDKDILNCNSSFYMKKQHQLIDKVILKYKEKEQAMTKEEREEYQAAYERGEKAFPLEHVLKEEAKKKRRDDKHKMTIAKKAAKQTLSDYAKMEAQLIQKDQEINRLRGEINQLKADNEELIEKLAMLEEPNIAEEQKNEPLVSLPAINEDEVDADELDPIIEETVAATEKEREDPEYFKKQIAGLEALMESGDLEKISQQTSAPADNSDIDESEATWLPTNNSEKVIKVALKLDGAQDCWFSTVMKNKLRPIDYKMRFFLGRDKSGSPIIIDPKKNTTYKLDRNNNFSVGENNYQFSKRSHDVMCQFFSDPYFYANFFLSYKRDGSDPDKYRVAYGELRDELGYQPKIERDYRSRFQKQASLT